LNKLKIRKETLLKTNGFSFDEEDSDWRGDVMHNKEEGMKIEGNY
jgi:hypothetical protein